MSQPSSSLLATPVHPFSYPTAHGQLTDVELAELEKARLWEAIQIARRNGRGRVLTVRWAYKLLPMVHGPHWLVDAILGGHQVSPARQVDLWHMTWRVLCSDPTAQPVCTASREVSDFFLLIASDPSWHVVNS